MSVAMSIRILFFISFLLPLSTFGQKDSTEGEERNPSVLYLKDGSVLKGKVRSLEEDTVRFEISGKQTIGIPRSEIKRIRMDRSSASPKEGAGTSPDDRGKSPGSPKEKESAEKSGTDTVPTSHGKVQKDPKSGSDKSSISDQGGGDGSWNTEDEGEKNETYYEKGYQASLAHGFFFGSYGVASQVFSIHRYRFSPYFEGGFFSGSALVSVSGTGSASLAGVSEMHLYSGTGIALSGNWIKGSSTTPFWELQAGIFNIPRYCKGTFFGTIGGGLRFSFGDNGLSLHAKYQVLDELDPDHKGRGLHLIKGLSFLFALHF